ncbi:hypothetical protein AVEN_70265-1 [Araneus ventricosus]|uniref:Uncharacterized protein n=1 Tax=Araneus ventricosus TaxID=182803 RepID=A0A4Y2GCY4_ARAVE|nr:hypothetical protein AVEN_70265-1 [Araneus ventricosus]
MDSKLSHCLKYRVTQLAPAIFADNLMMLIMDNYDIPWNPTFTTEDCYDEFFHNYGIDTLLDVEDIVRPWYETDGACLALWHVNEETLSKLLYLCKTFFCKKSDEDAKSCFLVYCTTMIYIALDYYKQGVTSALTIVFLEVYFLACYYLERTNFKCDLISTLGEFL